MTGPVFIDSNIWLYALEPAEIEPMKTAVAKTLIEGQHICISPQVVNEVLSNLIRKHNYATPLTDKVAELMFTGCNVIQPVLPIYLQASRLRGRYGFSF